MRPRVALCGLALLAVSAAFELSLSLRAGFSVDAIKDRAALARIVGDGEIENVYTLHTTDITEQNRTYRLSVAGLSGLRIGTPTALEVKAGGDRNWPVQPTLPHEAARAHRGQAMPIVLQVDTGPEGEHQSRQEKSTFYVPR